MIDNINIYFISILFNLIPIGHTDTQNLIKLYGFYFQSISRNTKWSFYEIIF